MLVVGAGITGIYQLYRAREAGFSAQLLEAGDGVGGTWYWNRYPGARFDSESYTYAYLFSKELFEEWEWQEHFAEQPEIERYLNHVVDRFDLRRHIRFDTKVTSAAVRRGVGDVDRRRRRRERDPGAVPRRRHRRALGAVLPRRAGARGLPRRVVPHGAVADGRRSTSPASAWPSSAPGRAACRSIPAIADEVASLTVYQRTANWCTPLNNAPITAEEQAQLRADFEAMCETLNTSPGGFLHRRARPRDLRRLRRGAAGVLRDDVEQPRASRSSPATTPTCCSITQPTPSGASSSPRRSASIVEDPETAEKLIPKDHRFGEKRPPFVTGYYEAFNNPNVSLVDLKETPIVRMTETRDRDVGRGAGVRHHRLGDRLRLRHRRAAAHGDPRPGRPALEDYWADGPQTFLGIQTTGFPNFFFPGGPHAAAGNNPRYNGDQVDFITDTLVYVRDHGYDTIEVDPAAEDEWTEHGRPLGAKRPRSGRAATTSGPTSPGSLASTSSTRAAGRSSSRRSPRSSRATTRRSGCRVRRTPTTHAA